MDKRSCNRVVRFGFVAAVLAALCALYIFNPSTTAVFPPCPFHLATGCHCPSCGSLRAIHNLLHGQMAAAMSQNPLMVLSIPILGLMFMNPRWIYKPWVPWTAMVTLIIYGLLRNVSVWPLTLLAPQ